MVDKKDILTGGGVDKNGQSSRENVPLYIETTLRIIGGMGVCNYSACKLLPSRHKSARGAPRLQILA